jgi:hypothetical protein
MTLRKSLFEQFVHAETEQELLAIQQRINEEGYSGFRPFLDDFIARIRSFLDDETKEIESLIERAKTLFPAPGTFSPSWERIWDELEQTVAYKRKVLETVPVEERDGEWQIIMDNPYVIQDVVCYPGLPFLEAAYMYGYFRPGLEKNEYLRLQKVRTVFMEFGS